MRKLVLVGMPGAGKSSVGRQLAKLLNFDFVDTDALIESRTGMPLSSMFAARGEAEFRDIEAATTEELLDGIFSTEKAGVVIATGGGVVLRDTNRRLIASQSSAVYLHAAPDQLFRRVQHDTKRPLLQGADKLATLAATYTLRDPLYRAVAHLIVDTGGRSAKAIAVMIGEQLANVKH